MAKEIPGRSEERRNKTLGSALLVVTFLAGPPILLAAAFGSGWAAHALNFPEHALALQLALNASWLSALFFVINASVLAEKHVGRHWVAVHLRQNMWVLAVALGYWGLHRPVSVTAATSLMNLMMVGVLLFAAWSQRVPAAIRTAGLDKTEISHQLRFGLPMLPVAFHSMGFITIVRLLVVAEWGPEKVAFFAVAIRLTQVVTIMLTNVFGTLRPHIYKLFNETDDPVLRDSMTSTWLARSLRWGILLSLCCVLTLVLVGQNLIPWITKPEYSAAAVLLVPLAVLPALQLADSVLSEPFYLAEKTRRLCGVVLLPLGSGLVLGPQVLRWAGGLRGACFLLAGMYGACVLLQYVAAPRALRPRLAELRLLRLIACAAIGVLSACLLSRLGNVWAKGFLMPLLFSGIALATGAFSIGDIRLIVGARRNGSGL